MIKIGFQQILEKYSNLPFVTVLWNNSDDTMNGAIDFHEPDILIINLDTIKKKVANKTVDYINKNHKKLKIIFLSSFITELIFEIFSLKGVLGFLHVNSKKSDIINCLKSVQNKQAYISPNLKNKIKQNQVKNSLKINNLDFLTKKEIDIIELIIKRKTTKEIALFLNNSPRTIETHRRNIAEKLDILGQGKLTYFLVENKKIFSELLAISKKNISVR